MKGSLTEKVLFIDYLYDYCVKKLIRGKKISLGVFRSLLVFTPGDRVPSVKVVGGREVDVPPST